MKVAIIGAGNMGGAIARGLVDSGALREEKISVSNPTPGKLRDLNRDYPDIYTTSSNIDVINDANLIIIAVKPWLMKAVIEEIAPRIDFSYQMIMSIAAGVTIADMREWTADWCHNPILFRAIPNTAIMVGESMTFISAAGASDEDIADVVGLFNNLGRADIIEERLMAAATALSSCGIAYAMRYIRAATEGGVELGIAPAKGRDYILQTLIGAVRLLAETGSNPEAEIDRVQTPGGLTIKGLNAMEEAGFTGAVIKGLRASKG